MTFNTNLTRMLCRYTGCVNTNYPCQGFRKLSSDKQTNRSIMHDRNYPYQFSTTPLRCFATGQKSEAVKLELGQRISANVTNVRRTVKM